MKTAVAALLAGLAGAGLMYWKGQRDATALRAEVDRLSKLAAASVPAAAQPPKPDAQDSPSRPVEKIVTVRIPDEATRQELVRLLDEKNVKLSSAEAAMRELRERIGDLETKLTQATRETEQLTREGTQAAGRHRHAIGRVCARGRARRTARASRVSSGICASAAGTAVAAKLSA
jgi:hypothetical protein